MQKLINKFKNNFWLLLNAIMPFIIFILPIYTENYLDEEELTTLYFNFFSIFNFNIDVFFSILCIIVIITATINLFLFVLLIINNLKIEFLYNKLIKLLAIINNLVLFIISIIMLVYTIILSCYTETIGGFIIYNSFHAGTVVFATYAIITNLFIFRNYKRK